MAAAVCCCLLTPMAMAAGDAPPDVPYDSYTYSADDSPLILPAPFTCADIVTGGSWGIGALSSPGDIFYDGEQTLFIADTGNNRVVITDPEFGSAQALSTFQNNGVPDAMNGPAGVCATEDSLYVADTGNARILVFDRESLELHRALNRPDIPSLGEDYQYKPLKLAVDAAGRIYVVAEGVNQGLIELDEDGQFTTFLGAPSVKPDLLELIWRKFATKEQIAQLAKYEPTEYDALQIDDDGFIYAVSKNSELLPIAKINSQGENVLNFEGDIGDEGYNAELRPYFTDLTVSEDETYYLLDSKQGKIFVYTRDGDFLFAFGGNATQQGCFYSASAIAQVGDRLLITDSNKNTITVLEQSAFGAAVLQASVLQQQGRYEEAYSWWQEVSRRCSHYPAAEIGIAREAMEREAYSEAMARLQAVGARELYAEAFEDWRDSLLRQYLVPILLGIVVLVAALLVVPRLVRRSRAGQRLAASPFNREYKYATYAAFHPFDGYWDIKREGKGSLRAAVLILILFTLLYAVRAQFSGYAVTGIVSSDVNVLFECLMILIPLGLYMVSNWCFTTLMDGEGSMKDIFIAGCYALKPYILFSIPLFLLSHVLTMNEAVFYQAANTLCWVWVLALLFFGMMMTHDYTLGKGLLTLLCTLIGMGLMIFIALLFVNVVQDVVGFVSDIYSEISFRFY